MSIEHKFDDPGSCYGTELAPIFLSNSPPDVVLAYDTSCPDTTLAVFHLSQQLSSLWITN